MNVHRYKYVLKKMIVAMLLFCPRLISAQEVKYSRVNLTPYVVSPYYGDTTLTKLKTATFIWQLYKGLKSNIIFGKNFYDANGSKVKNEQYQDNNVESIYEFINLKEGKIRGWSTTYRGNKKHYHLMYFDNKNAMVNAKDFFVNDLTDTLQKPAENISGYFYDNKNRLVKSVQSMLTMEYFYAENGTLFRKISYYKETPQYYTETLFDYDEENRVTAEKSFGVRADKKEPLAEIFYKYRDTLLVEKATQDFTNPRLNMTVGYSYNSNGQLTNISINDKDLYARQDYFYEKGKVIKKVLTQNHQRMYSELMVPSIEMEKFPFVYEEIFIYDAKGNLVSVVGTLNGTPYLDTKYVLEYY